jgi:hypothetical protein
MSIRNTLYSTARAGAVWATTTLAPGGIAYAGSPADAGVPGLNVQTANRTGSDAGVAAPVPAALAAGEGEGEGSLSPVPATPLLQSLPGGEGEGEGSAAVIGVPAALAAGEGEGEGSATVIGVPAALAPNVAPNAGMSSTTVPKNAVSPKTTVPKTTVPKTTVPKTTVPKTTVPKTTVSKTVSSAVGTVGMQSCKPGDKYQATTQTGHLVDVVCPTPKKRRKASCDSLFEGNGVHYSNAEAIAHGHDLASAVSGHSPGKDRCYDGRNSLNLAGTLDSFAGTLSGMVRRVEELEGSTSVDPQEMTDLQDALDALGSKVDANNTHQSELYDSLAERVGTLAEGYATVAEGLLETGRRVKGLEDLKLSELEEFGVKIQGAACKEDLAGYKENFARVREAEKQMLEARASFSGYTNTELGDAAWDTIDPLTVITEGDGTLSLTTVKALASSVKRTTVGYHAALSDLTALRDSIVENGCGYVEPRAWVGNGAVMAGYDGDGASFVAEASVLFPVGDESYAGFSVSGSPNGSANRTETERTEHTLPGGLTQPTTQTNTLTRNLGVRAVAGTDLTSRLRVDAGLGVAWMTEESEREAVVFGESTNMAYSESEIALEASAGVSVRVAGPLRVNTQVKLNTAGYSSLNGGVGADF